MKWVISLFVALMIICLLVIAIYISANALIGFDNFISGIDNNKEEENCLTIFSVAIIILLIFGLTCFVKDKIYGDNETTNIVCNEGNENCES